MITSAVIPAAGLGSRFYPITKSIPKEMLPIINKPLIHYVIEEAIESGIKNIAIITRKGKTSLEDFVDVMNYNANICYIRQNEALGLGDAVLKAEAFIDNQPFAILLGDEIILTNSGKPHLQELMEAQQSLDEEISILSTQTVSNEDVHKYGIIIGESDPIDDNLTRITDIIEKPSPKEISSRLASTGRYILTPEIFTYLKKIQPGINNELQLTDAIKLMSKDYDIYGYKLNGIRLDSGNPQDYLKTIEYVSKTLKEFKNNQGY